MSDFLKELLNTVPSIPRVEVAVSATMREWLANKLPEPNSKHPLTAFYGVPVRVNPLLPEDWMVLQIGEQLQFFKLDGDRLVEMVPPKCFKPIAGAP